jgi:hypothetical protein
VVGRKCVLVPVRLIEVPRRGKEPALPGGSVMSFGIYLTGFVVVIAGLIYGACLMHVPTHWIVVGGLVLVGLGILTGVKATRQKDSAT